MSSSNNRPIPVYNQACIASDSSRAQTSFYLVGSSQPGHLTVDYFNNFQSPPAPNPVADQTDQLAWDTNAKKLCFTRPNQQLTNPGIYVVQFGFGSTYMALAQTNNIVSSAVNFLGASFPYPKLFAWTGKHEEHDMFVAATNVTFDSKPNAWAGMRLDFTNTLMNLLSLDVTNNPVDSSQALLALGTYGSFNATTTQGYNIVFDKSGGGQIQSAVGNLQATVGSNVPAISLDPPMTVNMNGIKLTPDAIPVTMEAFGYILDKASNGSTIIYSINPSQSNTLTTVYVSGSSLPFSNILAASGLNSGIITYSSNGTVASFNIFDVKSGTWSGNGLVSTSVVDPNSTSSTPIGVIIGGIVGGLIVIAIIIIFLVRRRRQGSQKSDDSAELARLNTDETKAAGFDQGYVQYDHGYVQYNQGYIQYDQGHQHTPTFFPLPPTLTNQDAEDSYKVDAPASPTNPYVSPTSYRESTFRPLESPEGLFSRSLKLPVSNGPQYVPNSSLTASDARSPQLVSSTTESA
ncbi:MAG: hypothetical protein JOS17DRAFT_788277 [Linnemannia elongata]|nr:MAG: hypothetical protein JOS17DRAFT_788277 [Linnemannia elongata]